MSRITLAQAAQWCGGTVDPKYAQISFLGASNDSRSVKPGQLFVALEGVRDGHDFIPEGTVAEVQVTLAPEYYVDAKSGRTDWEALGDGATLTTQVTIDNTTPELTGVSVDPVSRQLTVTAKDNQFVAILSLYNPDNGASYGIFTPAPGLPADSPPHRKRGTGRDTPVPGGTGGRHTAPPRWK